MFEIISGTRSYTAGKTSWITLYILDFHLELLKVTSQSMNGVCSCKATRGTPASTIFKFLKFPKPPWAFLKFFCQFYRSWTNGACSCRERATPSTPASTSFNFFNIQTYRGHVYNNLWKFHRTRMNGVCSYTGHRERVYNNLWQFHRNRMNGMCSCKATPGTPASIIKKN